MTALAERKTEVSQPEVQRRRFSYAEFEQMSDLGLFADEHVELLNGEITVKGMQGVRHAQRIRDLNETVVLVMQNLAFVSTQCPMVLPVPPPDFVEPDIALLRLPKDQYAERSVNSADALLVIEVSDSTLERDRTAKLEAYARNGIQEYWILNVAENELEVHREPDGKTYISRRILKPGQSVSPLAFDDVQIEWWASV